MAVDRGGPRAGRGTWGPGESGDEVPGGPAGPAGTGSPGGAEPPASPRTASTAPSGSPGKPSTARPATPGKASTAPPASTADPRRIADQADFGRELTLARQQAGRTVREVARAAGIPPSTAGDYFAGRHLPPATQPALLARILDACGETDPARVAAWADALSRVRRGPGRRPAGRRPAALAPYPGLASFQPEDQRWFFGREELTQRLARLIAGGPSGLPLAVVGPSGSGKSSLLRAGLIPALPDRSRLALFTPGGSPLAQLARQLTQLGQAPRTSAGPGTAGPAAATTPTEPGTAGPAAATTPTGPGAIEAALRADPAGAGRLLGSAAPGGPGGPGGPAGGSPGGSAADQSAVEGSRPVLVIDQFEEVFTECRAEPDRQGFITAVCALAGPAVVAIALRADFYDRAVRYPRLARALQDRQVVVGPMTAAEVRRAIVEPARQARVEVDDGLVALLLRDLAPPGRAEPPDAAEAAAAHEPGALPLLSHALLTTWNHSRGGRLTVADYQASGGIQHAIARTADEVYASLDTAGRDIARRLFLRLVQVSDGVPETRSPVRLADLRDWRSAPHPPGEVLDRFVAARLITVDADSAEISHDALLTAWPLLRAWIDDNRDGMRTARRITEAAQAWDEAGRDHAGLLRGGQLAVARDWLSDPVNRDTLSALARTFVDTSIVGEKLQEAAERGRTRRLRRLVAALTVLVIATIALASYAFQQRQLATTARSRATAAAASAQSREVAVEAVQARAQDPALAAQLSVAAYHIAPTTEARASLLESSGTADAARLLDSTGPVQAVTFSPDHRVLAVAAADGTLRLWDVAHAGHPAPLGTPLQRKDSRQPLYAAAFGTGGALLAAAGAAQQVWLWHVSHPGRAVRLADPLTGPGGTIYALAFSPHAPILAAGSADGTVRLWNLADPAHPATLATLTGSARPVQSVAFSPDGTVLAAGCADGTVRLWNLADPAHPAALARLTGPAGVVTSVAFSPDGQLLAAASQDDKVWLWRVGFPARPAPAGTLTGAASWQNAVAFSPDGRSLAAGSSDNQVRVWNLASRTLTATLPQPQPVTSLAWDGPGRLVSGGADGEGRIWTLPSPVLRAGSPVNSGAYAPHGSLLAVGDSSLQIWDAARRTMLSAGRPPGGAGIVNAVGFSPGGTLVAAGYGHGDLQLWRVSAAGQLTALSPPLRAERSPTDLVEFTAFSPAGGLLASCGDDGTIRLWSVTDPARPRLLATVADSGGYVFSVAFRRDGKVLAAASADGLTRLWDIADPAHPAPLGRPLGGLQSYAVSVVFSPDGATLAVGSADKTVHLWDVADPARPAPLGRPLTGPGGYVYSVVFSPDGTMLGTGVTDGTVWLWRVADPARPSLVAELTGPGGNVYSVSFAPGGQAIAAGSADSTVRLWDTGAAAAARAACATAGQPLTRAEWAAYLPGRRYAPPCRSR